MEPPWGKARRSSSDGAKHGETAQTGQNRAKRMRRSKTEQNGWDGAKQMRRSKTERGERSRLSLSVFIAIDTPTLSLSVTLCQALVACSSRTSTYRAAPCRLFPQKSPLDFPHIPCHVLLCPGSRDILFLDQYKLNGTDSLIKYYSQD